MFVCLHKDANTWTHTTYNLFFSDICCDDPRPTRAFEVHFSSGECSVYWILKHSLNFPLHCKSQLQLSQGPLHEVQYFLLWGPIPSWEVYIKKNQPPAHNSSAVKETIESALGMQCSWMERYLCRKRAARVEIREIACNFPYPLHPQISLLLYRTQYFWKRHHCCQRPPFTHF